MGVAIHILPMPPLESLTFHNLTLETLPLDVRKDREPRTVTGACFSELSPPIEPLDKPTVMSISEEALNLLAVPIEEVGMSFRLSACELIPCMDVGGGHFHRSLSHLHITEGPSIRVRSVHVWQLPPPRLTACGTLLCRCLNRSERGGGWIYQNVNPVMIYLTAFHGLNVKGINLDTFLGSWVMGQLRTSER